MGHPKNEIYRAEIDGSFRKTSEDTMLIENINFSLHQGLHLNKKYRLVRICFYEIPNLRHLKCHIVRINYSTAIKFVQVSFEGSVQPKIICIQYW